MFKKKERASTEVVAVMLPEAYHTGGQANDTNQLPDDGRKNYSKNVQNKATKHVVKMLVAVVVAFFICWAPFHAQRLLAVYGTNNAPHMVAVFSALTYVSGVLYYLSTTINPLLYHIMSNKFREAFKDTLARCCGRARLARRRTAGGFAGGAQGGVGRCYSILSGRFSQNNESTSGGSNGAGYFGVDDNEGRAGVGSFRYLQETEVTSLREFRRPLVVSFRRRRRHVITSKLDTSPQETKIVAEELESELQEALASLADESKSRYPIFRSRRTTEAAPPAATGNNLSLHVVCREPPLESEICDREMVVLHESTSTSGGKEAGLGEPEAKGVRVEASSQRGGRSSVEAAALRSKRTSHRNGVPQSGRNGEIFGCGINREVVAKVEDIEIFQEQRFVMRELKRNCRVSETSVGEPRFSRTSGGFADGAEELTSRIVEYREIRGENGEAAFT